MKTIKGLMALMTLLTVGTAHGYGTIPTLPWITFCQSQTKADIPCTEATYVAKRGWKLPVKPVAATTPAYSVPTSWGTTAAAVTHAFPAVIAADFAANAVLNAQVTGSTVLLARFSTEMAAQDPTLVNTRLMYEHAAQKLSAVNLVLLRTAFGAGLDAYVNAYAPAAVRATYQATPLKAPMPLSAYAYQAKGTKSTLAGPSTSYLVDLVYMHYFAGKDTVAQSLQKTKHYAQGVLKTGALDVMYLTQSGSSTTVLGHGTVQAQGVQADGEAKPLASPAGVAGWIGFIITIIQFFDPNAGQQLMDASSAAGTAIAAPFQTPIYIMPPDATYGGGFPSGEGSVEFPPDDGGFSDADECGSCF